MSMPFSRVGCQTLVFCYCKSGSLDADIYSPMPHPSACFLLGNFALNKAYHGQLGLSSKSKEKEGG